MQCLSNSNQYLFGRAVKTAFFESRASFLGKIFWQKINFLNSFRTSGDFFSESDGKVLSMVEKIAFYLLEGAFWVLLKRYNGHHELANHRRIKSTYWENDLFDTFMITGSCRKFSCFSQSRFLSIFNFAASEGQRY